MDLRQCYKNTLEALEKKEAELAQEKQRVLEKEADLNTRELQIAEAYKQLEADIHTVSDIKDVKALKEDLADKQASIDVQVIEIKKKDQELKKYENQLFEIKTRQDEIDQSLRIREAEVAQREKQYREEIEKSFASNLAKNLLSK